MELYSRAIFVVILCATIAGCNITKEPTSLSSDDQQEALEKLTLSELIAVSEKNEKSLELVKTVLKHHFSEKALKIHAPFVENSTDSKNEYLLNENVEIQQFETAVKFLAKFGHLIPNITVEFRKYDNDDKADTINKLINKQCVDTLTELNVASFKNHFFDEFSRPFTKVQHLSLHGYFDKLGNNAKCFGELFPAVQHLNLDYINANDVACLDRNFPHLERLELHLSLVKLPKSLHEELFMPVFKKNPQIRKLDLYGISPYLLEAAAKELEGLEELQIGYYFEDPKNEQSDSETKKPIHFDSVKKFVMESSVNSIPLNVHFKNLIELQTDHLSKDFSRWIDLIESNEHLRKIQMNGYYLNQSEFSRMTAVKADLVQVSVECDLDVNDESISQFIENNKQLQQMKLHLRSEDQAMSMKNALQKKIDKKWKMCQHMNHIVLENPEPNHSSSFKSNVFSIFASCLLVISICRN